MKNLSKLFILFLFVISEGCTDFFGKLINGSGNIITENRSVDINGKISLAGSYDVELSKGVTNDIKVIADDNLQPYIITENNNGWLKVYTKKGYRLSSNAPVKLLITTNDLEALHIAGSGNIFGKDKFIGAEKLELKIAGSGNISLEVNTPEVKAEIAGSGDINLSGETKNETVKIAGHGSYKAENLKSENAHISIAGSGDVKVFADNKLSIKIAGSGDVYYKGSATVEQSVAGSGTIKKLN